MKSTQFMLERAKKDEKRWWEAYHSKIPINVVPVTFEEAESTTSFREKVQAEVEARPKNLPPIISIELTGRIDDFMEYPTLEELNKLHEELNEGREPPVYHGEFTMMFKPLGLSGTFMVTGIERSMEDEDAGIDDSTPWPLEVYPEMSAFDIMVAVEKSEANGYPDINHVWFEFVDIDPADQTIDFSMGS